MRAYVKVLGDKIVERKFNYMGRSAVDARPALNDIADIIMEAVALNFQSQGRRGGGSWRRVSPGWQARKIREGLDPRIGHATLALRHSMTERDDPDQILTVTRNKLLLGSTLPYAGRQNIERPFTHLLPQEKMLIRRTLVNHIMRAWRKRVREGK